jgi:hypothetical protein
MGFAVAQNPHAPFGYLFDEAHGPGADARESVHQLVPVARLVPALHMLVTLEHGDEVEEVPAP